MDTSHVLTNREMEKLSTEALTRLAAFLMEIREAMDKAEAERKALEQELEMALACLSEQALWEMDRRRG